MRLSHKSCCGLLNFNYYLLSRDAPLELQFHIVSIATEPIVVPQGAGGAQTDKEGYSLRAGDASTSWELNNVVSKAEVITLDNTVDTI